MEMDKTLMLQKQIKENTQDLQKEFSDMEAWEEQMKKKDLEIRNLKSDEALPAIRSKIKKKSIPTPDVSKDEKPKKPKRIGVSDYDAWNKFDADEACKEIDGSDNLTKKKDKKIYEIPSEEELQKEHEQAVKFKVEGNVLVKEQQYAKAVGKYSNAIKVFPHDATFYANRALCQLKLNNLYSAEADCTAAIQLDKLYVKAYHRRATARVELKRYSDAVTDMEMVVKLDPSNKEAANMLANLKKKVNNSSKFMVISGEDTNEKRSSIEKAIGEKLVSKDLLNTKLVKNIKTKQSPSSTAKEDSNIKGNIMKKNNESVGNAKDQINKKLKTCGNKHDAFVQEPNNVAKTFKNTSADQELPSWLPKCKKGLSIVQPLTKTPRRLNQMLKRISVSEVSSDESVFKDIEEISANENLKLNVEKGSTLETNNVEELKSDDNSVEHCAHETKVMKDLPPPPKSFVDFTTNWRKNVSADFRHKFLMQITPSDLPDIFKDSLESNLFSEILSILNTEFVSNNDNVYDLLFHFGKVKRFRALILFMTQDDKKALENLFEYCKFNEKKTDQEITYLRTIFEM